MASSPAVSPGLSGLGPEISQETYRTTCGPFTPSDSGQRSQPTYYRGCWHVVSRCLFARYRPYSSLTKEVYDPKAFVPHAASLPQAFAHWAKFPAAASRRSGGRISVPLWPYKLSLRLPVLGSVGHYPADYLIGREPLPERSQVTPAPFLDDLTPPSVRGISTDFSVLFPFLGQVTHALLSRLPLNPLRSPARLACIKRAASVRPEPGSNSSKTDVSSFHCSVVKAPSPARVQLRTTHRGERSVWHRPKPLSTLTPTDSATRFSPHPAAAPGWPDAIRPAHRAIPPSSSRKQR